MSADGEQCEEWLPKHRSRHRKKGGGERALSMSSIIQGIKRQSRSASHGPRTFAA
jgi:hypothetical protein